MSAFSKVATLVNKDFGSASMLCAAIYFLRLKLFDFNKNKACYRDDICFSLGVESLARLL